MLTCSSTTDFLMLIEAHSAEETAKTVKPMLLAFPDIEVKRVEKLNLELAMQQAVRDSELQKDGKPTVIHRKNGGDWLVTMKFEDWMELFRKWVQ